MKYIYITMAIFTITIITLNAQEMSIFLKATKSGWYPQFLNPVIDNITNYSNPYRILDIGTGPGNLPEMLISKDTSLQITGIDIDTAMIDEANRRVTNKNVSFEYQKRNAQLEFADSQFDVITFCSVLFLVDDGVKTFLMNEAMRVLKPGGKIIILTPSGQKSILSSFFEIWQYKFSINNFTFPIWKIATSWSGRKWNKRRWTLNYANENNFKYSIFTVFNNNATIEIVSKQ